MTYFRLRPRLSFCSIDGRAILLDIDNNRYFELPELESRALHELCRARGDGHGIIGIESLLQLAIIERGNVDDPPPAPANITVPPSSLLEETAATTSGIGPVFSVWKHVFRARHEIARGRFANLHARLGAVPPRRAAGPEIMARHLAAFLTARRFVPVAPNCLLDSVALFHHLARHELFANLVIGVRLDPFSAHCWLQTQDCVLNDPAEHAMTMTPILAL